MLFNVLPQLLDVLVAVAYLTAAMQPWVGGVVALTIGAYVPLTLLITERRGAVRKVMNALDGAREGRVTDMLLNYEAVKLATAEGYECARFDDATRQYQVRGGGGLSLEHAGMPSSGLTLNIPGCCSTPCCTLHTAGCRVLAARVCVAAEHGSEQRGLDGPRGRPGGLHGRRGARRAVCG